MKQKHADIMIKFANDANLKIQVRTDEHNNWIDTNNPTFFPSYEYRIKPEPIYAPFDFINAGELIGKTVKNKRMGSLITITMVGRGGVLLGSTLWSFKELYSSFTFYPSNLPCGKLQM